MKSKKKVQETDTESLPKYRLCDEVLLEIFDFYRQSFGDRYDDLWRKKYAWLNLSHVCRRWRAVMFASYSRLDLNIVVGPEKPSHIKTILSCHLPILIDYSSPSDGPPREITASALRRMRAALRHRDRVREISFGGWSVDFIRKFISATNYHFPALESLVLRFPHDQKPDIPATFLKGPDQSDVPLRRLNLYGCSLPFVPGILSSATALTDLTLNIPLTIPFISVPSSQESILLRCLQGMQCLRRLDLTTSCSQSGSEFQHPTRKDIVRLFELTHFHYSGSTLCLNNLMSRLSAPHLRDVRFVLPMKSPPLCLSRVIDDVKKKFRSISVDFETCCFRLLSSSHSREIENFKQSFKFKVNHNPCSIISIDSTSSTKLARVEKLALNFPQSSITKWENDFSMREFLRQFRSVRMLRISPFPFVGKVGPYLQQDDGEPILPLLEEIWLSDQEYQRRAAEAVATLEPLTSARERAGRPVKAHC